MTPEELFNKENSTLPNLKYLFTAYLHQDWDLEGESLIAVFQNHGELQGLCPLMKSEVEILMKSGFSNELLDKIFIDKWASGYEPDDRLDEDWHSILQEIADICDTYM